MSDTDRKRKFAKALLKNPKGIYEAASLVAEDDSERFRIARDWPGDEEVRSLMLEIEGKSENDDILGLPSKTQFIREIWTRLESSLDSEEFVKLAKLYADVRGYVIKPTEGTANVTLTNKVMIVPQLPSHDVWESEARQQQKMLMVTGEEIKDEPPKLN